MRAAGSQAEDLQQGVIRANTAPAYDHEKLSSYLMGLADEPRVITILRPSAGVSAVVFMVMPVAIGEW